MTDIPANLPPEQSIQRLCANCKHGAFVADEPTKVECRKFPPQVFPVPMPQGLQMLTMRPRPMKNWTCDLHERRTS